MKTLKIWGWILFASSIILYAIGLFSGEYTEYGLYGTSSIAIMLVVFSVMCMLIAITIMLVVIAINQKFSNK